VVVEDTGVVGTREAAQKDLTVLDVEHEALSLRYTWVRPAAMPIEPPKCGCEEAVIVEE